MSHEFIEKLSDEELMVLVREQNSTAAFTLLVDRYQTLLLNFFLHWGVKYDCEDLVQQTFLRLYRYRRRYEVKARFKTFVLIMARHIWYDEWRRRARRERLVDALAAEPKLDYQEANSASASVGAAGDLDLECALATLPLAMRQVIELGVYQDLPYAEIAEILEIPVGTVKSRMFNALARLRNLLNPEG